MTTNPDPKLVREIAEDAMRGAIADGMFWHVNQAVGDHGVPGLVFKGSTFEVHRTAAIAEYKRMADALSWPAEQPQDDGDVRAVAAFLQWFRGDPDDYVIESIGDQLLTVGVLRRMVAALEARDAKAGA